MQRLLLWGVGMSGRGIRSWGVAEYDKLWSPTIQMPKTMSWQMLQPVGMLLNGKNKPTSFVLNCTAVLFINVE